jgi:hypothetical protein
MKQLSIWLVWWSMLGCLQANAQFTALDSRNENLQGQKETKPTRFRLFSANLAQLKTEWQKAPQEKMGQAIAQYGLRIALPAPDGEWHFRIADIPVMEGNSQERYPGIKTFTGQCEEHPSYTLKMDVTEHGLHAAVYMDGDIWILDPVRNGSEVCMAYLLSDSPQPGDFKCLADPDLTNPKPGADKALVTSLGDQLRTYRMAIGTNVRFSNFYGGTIAGVLSALATKVNRINGIYERDFSVRLSMVSNSNVLVSLFSDTTAPELGVIHQTISNAIGGGNYDIGHYFGITSLNPGACGFNGLARLGVVCSSGSKGEAFSQAGVCAINNPWVDFGLYPHEIGHQFDASHTFNSSCSSNRSEGTAYEPGAGNSIMSYWFGCEHGVNDGSFHPFFHSGSFMQVSNYITAGGQGSGCPTVTATGNDIPVAVAGNNFYIPKSTPLKVRGVGSDPADASALTYTFDEVDRGPVCAPNSPEGNAPQFRFREPSSSNIRYLPALSSVVQNTSTTGESMPSYARRIRMHFTVRDNRAGAGASRFDSASYYVVGTAGPFAVTFPNTRNLLLRNKPSTITWDVAGTNLAPVNCSQVNILLSTDGGQTFPTVLASNTPNDGSQTVTMPDVASGTCRIMIESVNNIFYDVSNMNFILADLCYDEAMCDDIDFGQHFIRRFQMGSYSRNSTCAPNGYEEVNNSPILLNTGSTVSFSIQVASTATNQGVGMWIDMNEDGDFDDGGEYIYASPSTGSGTFSGSFVVPGSQIGTRTLRIRTAYATTFGPGKACFNVGFGETEDYRIDIAGYCFAIGICSDVDFGNHYISRVKISSLDNSSTCSPNGYSQILEPITALRRGENYSLQIETSTQFAEGVGVWIDYNSDRDFDDPGEFVYQGLPSTSGLFTGTIRIRNNYGTTRMRVRCGFNRTFTAGDACTQIGFGETEDYRVFVTGFCYATAICSDIDFGDHFIRNFDFPNIFNANSGCGNEGYTLYPSTQFIGKIGLGDVVTGSVQRAGNWPASQSMWIDYNNDDYFGPEELVASSGTPSTMSTWGYHFVTTSDTSFLGRHQMRVRNSYNRELTANESCASVGFGETEDYYVDIELGLSLTPTYFSTLCLGQTYVVNVASLGKFYPGNTFQIEMSDANGSFANPVLIGSDTSSSIQITIPASAVLGSGYQLRAVSSLPRRYSNVRMGYSVAPVPVATGISPASGAPGTVVTLSGQYLDEVSQVFFGQFPGTDLQPSPDGSSLQVVVPEGAGSGPLYLGGSCFAQGPDFLVLAPCTTQLGAPLIDPADQPGCPTGSMSIAATLGAGQTAYAFLFTTGGALFRTDTLVAGEDVSFTNLPEGFYTVQLVQGTCSTSTLAPVEVISHPCPVRFGNIQAIGTGGNTGKIRYDFRVPCLSSFRRLFKVIGGIPTQVAGEPMPLGLNTFEYSGLTAGNYWITYRDFEGRCADSVAVTVPDLNLPAPVISPGTGTYSGSQLVSISTSVADGEIYYTTTGNIPYLGTGYTRLYTGPFTVLQTTTVRAMVVKPGFTDSPVAVAYLTITEPGIVATPVISPGTGTYSGAQSVSLSCSTPAAQLYYSTNGNVPVPGTSFTRLYTGPFLVNSTSTIRVLGIKAGLLNSPVAVAVLTITSPTGTVATPVISPGSGIYAGPQLVTLSSSTPGASIYYTINGNVPLLSVPNSFTFLYSGPFTLSSSRTIRALATAPGLLNSAVAVATLTIAPSREALMEEASLLAVPNPGTGLFVLQSSELLKSVTVFSAEGREIWRKELEGSLELPVDLAGQPAGLYLIQAQTDSGIRTLRWSKR